MSEIIRGDMIWGLVSARGDLEESFKKLKDRGGNARRWLVTYNEDGNRILPNPYPFKPATFFNPGALCDRPQDSQLVPIFDIGRLVDGKAILPLAPEWKEKIALLAQLHAKYEIAPIICLSDRGSKSAGKWMEYNDWEYSNTITFPEYEHPERIVEIDGQGNKFIHRHLGGGSKARGLDPWRRALAEYLYGEFKKVGCPKIYADPENEYGYTPGPAWTLEDMKGWLQWNVEMLIQVGFTPCVSIYPDMTWQMAWEMFQALPVLFDIHCIKDGGFTLPLPAGRCIVNSDGTDGAWRPESSAYAPWFAHSLGIEQADRLGRDVKGQGTAGVIIIFQEASDNTEREQNLDAIAAWPAFEAASKATDWTPKPPVEYVTVKLCTMTGKIPNQYCPATFEHTYVKGEEQTEICTYHVGPPPPPPRSWF